MLNLLRSVASKRTDDVSTVTSPRVTRVTPEGQVIYDPLSVIRSEPARRHLEELEKQSPAGPEPTNP